MLGQTFSPGDLITIAVLVVLEGLLSLDNAIVLAVLVQRCPAAMRMRALSYGLIGALAFRIVAVALAGFLLHWSILQFIGGLYLLYVVAKHFLSRQTHSTMQIPAHPGFWRTVISIELTDIAFAADSILAAIALVGPSNKPGLHPKFWVIVTGGILGVILMRFAAAMFVRLLEKFPRLAGSAYLLVLLISLKLILDYVINTQGQPPRLDFGDFHRPEFWIFWFLMLIFLGFGLIPRRRRLA